MLGVDGSSEGLRDQRECVLATYDALALAAAEPVANAIVTLGPGRTVLHEAACLESSCVALGVKRRVKTDVLAQCRGRAEPGVLASVGDRGWRVLHRPARLIELAEKR